MSTPKLDDPELTLTDMMSNWPATIPVFLRHKMLCVGCSVGVFHTLVDACMEYHLDPDNMLSELMAAVA